MQDKRHLRSDVNSRSVRVQLIEHKPTSASQTTPGQPTVPEVIVYVNRADRD